MAACSPPHLSFFIHFFLHLRLWVPVQPQSLALSSQSMHCSRDSLVGKLRGENVLKLIMASCDENIWSVVGTCSLPRQDRCCAQNEQNNFLQEFNCQTVEKSSSIFTFSNPSEKQRTKSSSGDIKKHSCAKQAVLLLFLSLPTVNLALRPYLLTMQGRQGPRFSIRMIIWIFCSDTG